MIIDTEKIGITLIKIFVINLLIISAEVFLLNIL